MWLRLPQRVAQTLLPARALPHAMQAHAQAQVERARHAEQSRDEAQGQAEQLRQEVQRLRAADQQWRAGKAALVGSLAAAQKAVEGLP